MKRLLVSLVVISIMLMLSGTVQANVNHDHADQITKGKELVESGANCAELDEGQLETIGEYLMEQIHPRKSHEAMHEMMGMKEGTNYHKRFHVNLAQRRYCDGDETTSMPIGERGTVNETDRGHPGMMGDMMPTTWGGDGHRTDPQTDRRMMGWWHSSNSAMSWFRWLNPMAWFTVEMF